MEIYSVSQVCQYLREILEVDCVLQDLWVEGEVSNLALSAAGHCYFTLKDSDSQLRCVLFRGRAFGAGARPADGAAVVAHGRISLYEPQGSLQFYVDLVQPEGVGMLRLRFEALRAALEREGLFDPARKRPLPRYPQRLGVVTSPTGAALRDIIQVVSRRFPSVELVLAPASVQGEQAVDEICEALVALNEADCVDLIILARGGGSLEDLWPFNEERVARAIYASRIPVICGVGHETDVTIADLVADLRAPTPSAAAEMAVPDIRECRDQVWALCSRLRAAAQAELSARRTRLTHTATSLRQASPLAYIEERRQRVDDLARAAAVHARHWQELRRERVRGLGQKLEALDPRSVLGRGYSLVWLLEGRRLVRRVQQVTAGDAIQIEVCDGPFRARVEPVAGSGDPP